MKRMCRQNGIIVLSLLRKKFSIKRIKQLMETIQIKSYEIVDVERCEDIIIIAKMDYN